MKVIRFSGKYPKLHDQDSAKLLAVEEIKIDKNTPKELIEYDTKKSDGTYYELKTGYYLQLIFLGEKRIPFCTIRSAFPQHKINYYKNSIGEIFTIKIEEE